jgi:hypothetical protein
MVVAVAVPVIAPGPLEGRLPTCELRARVRRVHGGVACCQPAAASGPRNAGQRPPTHRSKRPIPSRSFLMLKDEGYIGIDHRLLLESTIGSFTDQPSALYHL